ncbi:carboxypeptidase-like regulatory domain-containing protein, partial [uncultured Flavobacterium sp.]
MKYLAFLFLFCSLCVQAQFRVTGIIKDEASKKPLPFATIQSSSGRTTIADVTGKFEFISSSAGEKMVISYLNYKSKEFIIDKTSYFSVFLQSGKELSETELIQKQEQSKRFLNSVYTSIEQNNPKKALSTFQYKGYNKIVVTAHPDS